MGTRVLLGINKTRVSRLTYPCFYKCRRWDLNPHKRIAYKILSLARLPVPTLLHNGELPYSNILPRDVEVVNSFFEENEENLYIYRNCDIIDISLQNGGTP